MKKIKIICDSIADMPKSLKEQYGIHEVDLTVRIDDIEYKSSEIENEQFYDMIKTAKEVPKTSQATYVNFKEAFDRFLNEGNQILYISGSSKSSGTYQSAMLAKSDTEGEIYIFDSMNISFGCGIQVLEAARMVQEGKSVDEILERLEYLKERVHLSMVLGSLEYLKKGGRISTTKAMIGEALGVRPILTVKEGLIEQSSQVRGSKKILPSIIKQAIEACEGDFSDKTICIGCGDDPAMLEKLKELVEKELSPKEIISLRLNSIICSHTGPNIIGLVCFK